MAAAARPSAVASSAVRNRPATPRTPSVPNSLRGAVPPSATCASMRGLALGELRPLACLLEPCLLTFLHARVAREVAAPLELAAQRRIGLDERARDAVPQRDGLRRHAAAVDARDDVQARVVARGLERLLGDALELDAREVLVEVAAVDAERALARAEDHARDGALALAGGAIAGVGGQVQRRVGDRRGLRRRLVGGLVGC